MTEGIRSLPYHSLLYRAMVCALADTGRMTYADTERLLRWLTEYQAANPEYDYE